MEGSKILYLISQDVNSDYDTYSSAVVVASSEDKARLVHPDGCGEKKWWLANMRWSSWALPSQVNVEYLADYYGPLECGSVVCASFHAS